MSKFYPISIAFACNDEHGNFEGKFSSVNIGNDLLNLDNQYIPPRSPKLRINYKESQSGGFGASKGKGHIKISRRWYPIVGYRSYWGNMMWDLVIVSPDTAKDIIDYLKQMDVFTCDSDEVKFFDKFNGEGAFEWTDYELLLLAKDGYQKP